MRASLGVFVLALGLSFAALGQNTEQGAANGGSGAPVATTAMGIVAKLPHGGRPAKEIAFPEISDWRSLKIVLQRGVCFGTCPVYRVEIDGDGTVSYEGDGYVAIVGAHKTHVSEADVRDLFAAFRKAKFFWLLDSYRAPITDFPDYSVAIAFDSYGKAVDDYAGDVVGMPKDVRDLEEKIDRIAETKRWVAGDATTLTSLQAEGWDFHAGDDAHVKLLESAADSGSAGLLKALLDAGVPASNPSGCAALESAAYQGEAAKVAMLLAAKAQVYAPDKKGDCIPLMEAAQRGDGAIVKLLIDAHADVNARDGAGRTVLMNSDDPGIVTALLAAGADLHLKDNDGKTILDLAGPKDEIRPILERWMTEHPQK
jgi:hypothetical protein